MKVKVASAVLYIFSVNVVSFSLCPKRATCGPTGSTQFNSTARNKEDNSGNAPVKTTKSELETNPLFFLFFFFSPLLFPRRRSLLDDCFTGQSPGSAISIPAAPDVHEGLSQIQASAP